MRVLKFLASGVLGITVNLSVFHILYVTGASYLLGSTGGFVAALFVGFVLQKYWTFEERAPERVHTQLALYVALALVNLALNTGIVYVLIGTLDVYYLLAQVISAAIIAIESFFIYRTFVFKPLQSSSEPGNL